MLDLDGSGVGVGTLGVQLSGRGLPSVLVSVLCCEGTPRPWQLLEEKTCDWGLAYRCSGLAQCHSDGKPGGMQASAGAAAEHYILICRQRVRERMTWHGPLKPYAYPQ